MFDSSLIKSKLNDSLWLFQVFGLWAEFHFIKPEKSEFPPLEPCRTLQRTVCVWSEPTALGPFCFHRTRRWNNKPSTLSFCLAAQTSRRSPLSERGVNVRSLGCGDCSSFLVLFTVSILCKNNKQECKNFTSFSPEDDPEHYFMSHYGVVLTEVCFLLMFFLRSAAGFRCKDESLNCSLSEWRLTGLIGEIKEFTDPRSVKNQPEFLSDLNCREHLKWPNPVFCCPLLVI